MSLAAISGERDRASSPTVALARRSLLIVDSDSILRERLAAVMRACGFDVSLAGSYAEALALARASATDMLLLDPRLPGRSGLALIDDLRALHPTIAVVIWTAYARIGSAGEAHRFSALPRLRKPADADDILAAFGHARTRPR